MAFAQPGEALGASYRFEERIGSGAVGEVWRISTAQGQVLAAKLLRPEHADDPALVERFIKERSVLLALRAPGIVAVRDLVVEGSRLAIVMDFVDGGSVRELLETRKTLPARDALSITAHVLDALAVAHEQNITHRDIKPDNLLLDAPDPESGTATVMVSDFGIASVLDEGQGRTTSIVGTPLYMSPELISHGRIGAASDVYSAGIVLYELLAGRTPYAGKGTDFTVAYRHVTSVPPPIDVPEGIWRVVESMLAKVPSERPAARDAAAQLRRLADQFADLPAAAASSEPEEFDLDERPATVIRGVEPSSGSSQPPDPYLDLGHAPELGEATSHTVVRPIPQLKAESRPQEDEPEAPRRKFPPEWMTKKMLLLLGCALLLVAGAAVAFFMLSAPKTEPTAEPTGNFTAFDQGQPLPTGLGINRNANYDATNKDVKLTITYSAQKAPLSGPILETINGLDPDAPCPSVSWEGAKAERNRVSVTGVESKCGWVLQDLSVPAGQQVEVTATVNLSPPDEQALKKWLSDSAAANQETLNDPKITGTVFPVQRLQSIEVKTSTRVVSQSPLDVTLLPVWPSGTDQINPIYKSPSTGKPSQMLNYIAGGESGVRFADGCSGSLAVSSDGLSVTALSVSPNCVLLASVGNFTSLQSQPFGITTREG